jgi:hypothetical protein
LKYGDDLDLYDFESNLVDDDFDLENYDSMHQDPFQTAFESKGPVYWPPAK